MSTQYTQAEFRLLVLKCIERAEQLYDVNFGRVTITFDLKGETAAKAYQVPNRSVGYVYKLRFNREAIRIDGQHMVERVIPHEVAHLVAFAVPKLRAEGHNRQWKFISTSLGDITKGETYHTLPLKPARRSCKFVYENDRGLTAMITPNLHRKVQAGKCGFTYMRQDFNARHFREAIILKP